ncbi:MAG: type II toxin-antitoxin system mRNA interferase toxin, RelE/StbE family [Thermodesulfovibrionales bacterium]|nr:type II toxin-antitoxin system mRNA interferase toxin, RelE/StbE family [Thermodesulfovibrionales bacterium]
MKTLKMTIKPYKTFLKRAKKLLEKNPQLKEAYAEIYLKLENNPFDPSLHTHPLTGELQGKYACSLTYDLRIVFKLSDDIIHLLDIGSHDEVY